MLTTSLKDHPFDCEHHLQKVCMAYNTSMHASTGYTPCYLLFGHEARLPIDLMFGTTKPQPQSVHEYAAFLKASLTDAYRDVREALDRSHIRQKDFYDKKIHGEPYKKGDLVWLLNPTVPPGQSAKLVHPWTGPYRIVERLSDADYRIQEVYGKKSPSVVHFNRLKKCHPDTRFLQPGIDPDESNTESSQPLPLYSHFELESVEPADSIATGMPLRRSTRSRREPDRYQPVIMHKVEFGTNSLKGGGDVMSDGDHMND